MSDSVTVLPSTPDVSQTSQSFAQQQIYKSSVYERDLENSNLIAKYHRAYADYLANMQSGQNVPPERRVPPVPDMAWELAPPDKDGYVWPRVGTTPVCPQGPPVTANFDNPAVTSAPGVPHDGLPAVFALGPESPNNPGWFEAAREDTEPGGYEKTLPGPDGVMITVMKVVTPWGGKYEKVK